MKKFRKLFEDGGLAQNTLLVKKKKPMSTATAEISFQSVKEVAEIGDDPTNQGTPEGLVKRGNKTVLKKYKELTELVAPEAKDDIKSLDSMSFLKKHGLTKTRVKERLANEDIERVEEMDKSQTPPGRDGGYQFAPGPKVSKKDIEAVKKNPAKHLSDLFAKQYAKKKLEKVVKESYDKAHYQYVSSEEGGKHFDAGHDVMTKHIENDFLKVNARKSASLAFKKNPHKKGTPKHKAWHHGADAAKEEHMDGLHEEVMVEGGQDNAGGQYYDIKNSDGTIGMGYKPGKHYPSSSSRIEIKSEPKHPLHGKQVTNGKVTGKLIGTEHQGSAAKIKHSSGMIHHVDAKDIRKADIKEEAKDPKEYGYEGDMAMNQLQTIMRHAEYLMDMMKPDTDLPEWVQSKITLAADYIQTSCDYMTSEMKEETMSEEIKKGDYVKDTVHGHVHHVFDVRDNNLIVGRYHGRNSYGGTTNLHMSKAKKVEKPMGEATEPPFAGPYKKPVGTVKDKSGAVHTPMSRAKDLAKKAAMRQAGMKKESIHESRRADIIREAMKAAKEKVKKEKSTADEDKFVADPELNSKVIKTASQM
jgi:hypothetical protein